MNAERLLALYPVLGKLPPGVVQRIRDSLQTMTIPSGTVVFDERQPCRGFPFVLEGTIRVAKCSGSGRELPLYRLLPRPLFDEMLGEPAFRDFVFALFSERMAELMQLVEEVAFRKLDQRLAALLLGKGRLVHATHQQLADELGSVREMVSRLLKGFAEQGLVRLGREQVEVLDAAGLRKMASVT